MIVANIFGLAGGVDIAIVGVVVLVLFGGSKVGGLLKSLGEGVKEFKKASTDDPAPTTVSTPVAVSSSEPSNGLNSPEAPTPSGAVGEVEKVGVAAQASKE